MTRQVEVEPGETVEITAKPDEEKSLEELFKEAMEEARSVEPENFEVDQQYGDFKGERIRVTVDNHHPYRSFGRQLLEHGLVVSSVKDGAVWICRAERFDYKVMEE